MKHRPEIVPCVYKRAYSVNGVELGFWVVVNFIFDGNHCYHFLHRSDLCDNINFALECGVFVDTWSRSVFVDKAHFPHIYQQILDYERICATTPI